MAHREELEPLQGALSEALGGLAKRGAPSTLWPLWQLAAGAAAAGSSRPVSFERGTLQVEIDTPAWLAALQGQEAELVARLKKSLPGFSRLELRLRWGNR
ncbi:MAG: DUF721 domain-containing protein [Deltaproteobacteria bacterium]|nr:DUF721 domain-containing protein [Deltaproteobacteria bacterium]